MVWVGKHVKDHLVPAPTYHGQGQLVVHIVALAVFSIREVMR